MDEEDQDKVQWMRSVYREVPLDSPVLKRVKASDVHRQLKVRYEVQCIIIDYFAIYIFISVSFVVSSCPKSSTCFFFSDNSIFNVTRVSFSPVFQYFVTYVYMYAMCHGIVLSAMDSSTLNLSAMDSSAVDVGVAVLVGKCMQGPCSAVPDIRSIR